MRLRNKENMLPDGPKGFFAAVLLSLTLSAPIALGQQPIAQTVAESTHPQWPRISRDVAFDSKVPVPELAELQVFEDGTEQPDVTLQKDTDPVSICMIMDLSGSMYVAGSAEIEAARRLAASVNPGDEIEIIGFSVSVYVEQEFTSDPGKIDEALSHLKFQGGSSFYDAVSASLDHMKTQAPKYRLVFVIFSDGDDNMSSITRSDLIQKLTSPDAPIVYTINPIHVNEGSGQSNLADIVKATGGVAFEPAKLSMLPGSVAAVIRDIHSRYRLEYSSTHTQRDGKRHKIEVRIQLETGASKPKTIFRQEYHAPL